MDKKKPTAPNSPDLRHGVRGSLTLNELNAGSSPDKHDDGGFKPVSPDENEPVGQATHD
jgi:hypothetical protein